MVKGNTCSTHLFLLVDPFECLFLEIELFKVRFQPIEHIREDDHAIGRRIGNRRQRTLAAEHAVLVILFIARVCVVAGKHVVIIVETIRSVLLLMDLVVILHAVRRWNVLLANRAHTFLQLLAHAGATEVEGQDVVLRVLHDDAVELNALNQ